MPYLCLDLGNVLVKADFNQFLRHLSKALNISLEEANDFLSRTQKLHDLGFTRISDELKDHFKIRSPVIIEELLYSWNDIIDTANYVIDRIIALQQTHDLKIALLSNIGFDHVSKLDTIFKFASPASSYRQFYQDAIKHFSCLVGARKPSLMYYQSFLAMHPEFIGATYIDDLQENLNASQQFGFRTYRFAIDELIGDGIEQMTQLENFITN